MESIKFMFGIIFLEYVCINKHTPKSLTFPHPLRSHRPCNRKVFLLAFLTGIQNSTVPQTIVCQLSSCSWGCEHSLRSQIRQISSCVQKVVP